MHSYFDNFVERDWTRYDIRPDAWGNVPESERPAWAVYIREFAPTAPGMWSHTDGDKRLLIADQMGTPLGHAHLAAAFARGAYSPVEYFALCEQLRYAVAYDDLRPRKHRGLFRQWFTPEEDGRLTFTPEPDAWHWWRIAVMSGKRTPRLVTQDYLTGEHDWRTDLERVRTSRPSREEAEEA